MTFIRDKQAKKALLLVLLTLIVSLLFIDQPIQSTSWSLLPPALAIVVAFISGRLSLSLGSAVFLGSFISVYGNSQSIGTASLGMITRSSSYFLSAALEPSNLLILGFVFFILSMVHIITLAGGLHAVVRSLQKWIVGPKSAQFVTAVLGCLIFIDDYANTMIVGSTMKSVTDKYRISREKLAFLVDATSAPVAGVALVSTWIGYEVGLFSEMATQFQWGIDGYAVFLDAIQFRFYCFLMLFFVFVNIYFGAEYGPMKESEDNATFIEPEQGVVKTDGHIASAVLPLGLLLLLVFALLWQDGGGMAGDKSLLSLTSWREVLTQSKNGIWILFLSSMISYGLSVLLALVLAKVSFIDLGKSFVDGLKSAWIPILILILAWSLKLVCDDLKTGEYIVAELGGRVNGHWLPIGIFIVSALTAFSTGTSWGTMAILIPTVTPLAVAVSGGEYGLFVSLCLAAILDGAIMGDHCSPISDTTIMSSISTECDLMSHVRTQLPYSLTVGLIALLFGYLPAGFSFSLSFTIPVALLLILSLFFILNKRSARRGATL